MRQRQLLLRVLKLWIVVNDHDIYELAEEKPIMLEAENLPIKISAKNGYHLSKPLFIQRPFNAPLYIEVGCTADNGRLWGGVAISFFLFLMFWASDIHFFLFLANLPLLFVAWHFFFNKKEFITVSVLRVEDYKD